jgi:hypothetical protein
MKKIQWIGISILWMALVMVSTQCKKECADRSDPICSNYDPCYKKVSADFKMGVRIERTSNIPGKYFEVDTVPFNQIVTFSAKDSTDVVYEWVIGTDPDTLRSRAINIHFTFAAEVNIHLTVRRKTECGLSDGGSATLNKKLVVANTNGYDMLIGQYEGYLESKPSDIFKVDMVKGRGIPYIDGLPRGCKRDPATSFAAEVDGLAYRDFAIGPLSTLITEPCSTLNGWGRLEMDNTMKLDFEYNKNDRTIIKDKFIGKKIK